MFANLIVCPDFSYLEEALIENQGSIAKTGQCFRSLWPFC